MRVFLALVATALVLVAVPVTSAQDVPATGIVVTPEAPLAPIAPGSAGSQAFTAEVGCFEMVLGGGSTTLNISVVGPSWAGASAQSIELSPADCPTASGVLNVTGSIDYAISASAPGMAPESVEVTASIGDSLGTATTSVTAGYRGTYTLGTDTEFPVQVTEDTVTFNILLTVDANADTMVMFATDDEVQTMGTIAVPTFLNFRDLSGPTTSEVSVTYTAPTAAWEQDRFQFTTWSHYLNDGAVKSPDQVITWSFDNAGTTTGNGADEGEDSPGAPLVLLSLALVGVAMVLRRRAA